jgi:protein TonB
MDLLFARPFRLRSAILPLGIFLLVACSDDQPQSASTPQPAAQGVPVAEVVQVDRLADARVALREGRLIAPAGNNAVEAYLAVPDTDPAYAAAQQAMLELHSPAAAMLASAIETGELDDIPRQLDLYKRMGASEVRLEPLRAKYAAARKAADAAALAAAAPPPVAAPAPSAPLPRPVAPPTPAPATAAAPPNAPAIAPGRTDQVAVAKPASPSAPPASPTSAPAAVAPSAIADIQEARQISDAAPTYPPAAMRRRLEGLVELEFLVGANGKLSDISVARSVPPGIFDREAIRAAQRWSFSPRTVNGEPVPSKVRKTLNFRLKASQG